MTQNYKQFKPTELTKAFDQFNTFFYLSGMKGFWVNDLKLSKNFIKFFDKFSFVMDKLILLASFSLIGALFTQDSLTPKQSLDVILIAVSAPVISYYYYVFLYYRAEVKHILYHLVVVLKEHYYNKEEQMQMFKKMKLFLGIVLGSQYCMLIERGGSSIVRTIVYGDPLYAYIGAWPDLNEESQTKRAIGALINSVLIWCCSVRTNVVFTMTVILLMTHTYQFKDLQSYFYKLDDIFKDNSLSQEEKEKKYEDGFVTGIHMHAVSLRCVVQCQHVYRTIFSTQLLITLASLTITMPAFISSDNPSSKLTLVPILGALLTIAAIYMWNAGNITFEAQMVANAMYASGWQNCNGKSSMRVRKLLVNSMMIAQKPVVLKAFGVVEMSYRNYMSIVKTSYSVYSVFV